MTITFSVILFGLLILLRPLQKSGFFMLNAAMVILAAYYVENNMFKVTPFAPKTFLLFVAFQFVSINIVTFIAYWADKRAARKGKWRISEAELHSLEFLGGWSGALLGQKVFNHKTKKKSFQAAFWVILSLQLTIIFFILKFLKVI